MGAHKNNYDEPLWDTNNTVMIRHSMSKVFSNAANNAVNPDVQKLRFALLLHAGYSERWSQSKRGHTVLRAHIKLGAAGSTVNLKLYEAVDAPLS